MARKTFSVEKFKSDVNAYLLNSRDDQRGERRGQQVALESILHATGNYNGFGYLNSRAMTKSIYGNTYGINSYNTSEELEAMQAAGTLFEGTDNSRVFYY